MLSVRKERKTRDSGAFLLILKQEEPIFDLPITHFATFEDLLMSEKHFAYNITSSVVWFEFYKNLSSISSAPTFVFI